MNRKMTLSRGLAVALSLSAAIAGPADVPQDLTKVSLEDRMNVQVTSVSKKEQRLFRGAAVSVLTQEDIYAEFHNAYEVRRTLAERSGFGKITWRF